MDVQGYATQRITSKPVFPWISWSAVFGGLAGGMATYMLLALLGVAAGLSAINPQATEPVGRVPIAAAIWTGISMIISAFVGGYVAARLSGMSRLADGIFHGFVAWGVSTILFAYLLTTAAGSIIGGAFGVVGQGLKVAAQGAVAGSAGLSQSQGAQSQIESLIKGGGGGGGNISQESISALQQRLSAGDRTGAVNIMVNQMGFEEDRANQIVNQASALSGTAQQLPGQARNVASTALSGMTMASWSLFAGVLLSMALGIWGGAIGARATSRRRTAEVIAH